MTSTTDLDERVTEAVRLMRSGRQRESAQLARDVLARLPGHAEAETEVA